MIDQLEQQRPMRRRRVQTAETRERIRRALLGRKHTDERRKNISDALAGRALSDDHRAACSRAQTGRVVTAETGAKISAAKKKGRKPRPLTRESRIALSVALTGRIFSQQHRRRLSEAVTGLKVGHKWIINLTTSRERLLPYDEAADLVATGSWRFGRRRRS
jgi:NUMOD3 motif